MGYKGLHMGYNRLQGVTGGYKGLQRRQEVKRGYRDLQRITRGYRGLQQVTRVTGRYTLSVLSPSLGFNTSLLHSLPVCFYSSSALYLRCRNKPDFFLY